MIPIATESTDEVVVKGSCHHDCPDTCQWEVTVSDGRAVKLRGSEEHAMTNGQLCPKVNRFLNRVYHSDRLLSPMRRVGPKGSGEFEPISWDVAIDTIAGRLSSLIDTGRVSSVLQYSLDGTQGVVQKGVLADRFFDTIGASDVYRHVCGFTAWLGAAEVSGTPFGIDPEQIEHARTIVLWGTNTLLTNRHLWPTIERAREAGAHVIVIDPIRTATASRADEFIQLRPGTDIALMLGLVHLLDRDGLLDQDWIANNTSGWDELQESAAEWTPSRCSRVTGLDPSVIDALAHRLVENRPTAYRSLVGPEHRAQGRDIMRAIALLPALTGAWREVGGGLARSTQVYFEAALNMPTNRPTRRTFNMARLGEVLLDDTLDPAIEMLFVHNSNPVSVMPDQNKTIAGLERDDLFTVVAEHFITDTARYADILLPATMQIEHLDLGLAWGHMYLSLNQPAIEPLGEALPNTEIFRRLAAAVGLDEPSLYLSDEALARELLDSDHEWLDGITFERLAADGWARLAIPETQRPYVDTRPATDDGKLHLGSIKHAPASETPDGDPALAAKYPLALMSRKQHTKFLNASYGGFEAHLPSPAEPRLEIHPVDAEQRSIETGTAIRIYNDRGELSMRASVSEDTQPGLVTMPFGWWNQHSPEDRSVNALCNGNVGADDQGSPFFHENLVEVVAAERTAS